MTNKNYYIKGVLVTLCMLNVFGLLIMAYKLDTMQNELNTINTNSILPGESWMQHNNQSINGVYFNNPTMCIGLNQRNYDYLNETIAHEYLHHIIEYGRGCGNISCYDHFCK